MTYNELLKILQGLTKEQLEQDVTIWESGVDEYYPLWDVKTSGKENGVLDEGHIYLELEK